MSGHQLVNRKAGGSGGEGKRKYPNNSQLTGFEEKKIVFVEIDGKCLLFLSCPGRQKKSVSGIDVQILCRLPIAGVEGSCLGCLVAVANGVLWMLARAVSRIDEVEKYRARTVLKARIYIYSVASVQTFSKNNKKGFWNFS